MKILVTGATGMLGRAVMAEAAKDAAVETIGLCHSRVRNGLIAADLTQTDAIAPLLDQIQPDVIIHTAAIRRPEEFAADTPSARRLNVDATAALARWTAAHPGTFLLYLSSDYAFDGTTPPYRPDDPVHPINGYGVSKVEGEDVIRAHVPERAAILRVPILYGDVETLDESSVTTVIAAVLDMRHTDTPRVFDDWAVRYPTHVADVAEILLQLAQQKCAGTFHWSGPAPLTKFDMATITAGLIGVDPARIQRSGAPANGSEPRPKDCHLDRSDLEARGFTATDRTFDETTRRLLARFAAHA
jgi:dTDP-4-dehydrorhamnose reductase